MKKNIFCLVIICFIVSQAILLSQSNDDNKILDMSKNLINKYNVTEEQIMKYLSDFKSSPYLWPIKNGLGEIKQKMGMYLNNKTELKSNMGIVIGADNNTEIIATADGKVIKIIDNEIAIDESSDETYGTEQYPRYGFRIIISHRLHTTIYSNLESINVKFGDKVEKGQVIGKLAKNENLKISYLFYMIKVGNSFLNPEYYILR